MLKYIAGQNKDYGGDEEQVILVCTFKTKFIQNNLRKMKWNFLTGLQNQHECVKTYSSLNLHLRSSLNLNISFPDHVYWTYRFWWSRDMSKWKFQVCNISWQGGWPLVCFRESVSFYDSLFCKRLYFVTTVPSYYSLLLPVISIFHFRSPEPKSGTLYEHTTLLSSV